MRQVGDVASIVRMNRATRVLCDAEALGPMTDAPSHESDAASGTVARRTSHRYILCGLACGGA